MLKEVRQQRAEFGACTCYACTSNATAEKIGTCTNPIVDDNGHLNVASANRPADVDFTIVDVAGPRSINVEVDPQPYSELSLTDSSRVSQSDESGASNSLGAESLYGEIEVAMNDSDATNSNKNKMDLRSGAPVVDEVAIQADIATEPALDINPQWDSQPESDRLLLMSTGSDVTAPQVQQKKAETFPVPGRSVEGVVVAPARQPTAQIEIASDVEGSEVLANNVVLTARAFSGQGFIQSKSARGISANDVRNWSVDEGTESMPRRSNEMLIEPVNFRPLPSLQSENQHIGSTAPEIDLFDQSVKKAKPKMVQSNATDRQSNAVCQLPSSAKMVPIVRQPKITAAIVADNYAGKSLSGRVFVPADYAGNAPILKVSSPRTIEVAPKIDSATQILRRQENYYTPNVNQQSGILRLRATTTPFNQQLPPVIRFNTESMTIIRPEPSDINKLEVRQEDEFKVHERSLHRLPSINDSPAIDAPDVSETIRRLTVRPEEQRRKETDTIDR